MVEFPHKYVVSASTNTSGTTDVSARGVPTLTCASPAEFGGPGDLWSPESLLVAAVADCFVLSFVAIARAFRLEWDQLSCEVTGILDRIDRVTQFTAFQVSAELHLPSEEDEERALKLLEKSEKSCLILNSMKAESRLNCRITVAA